MSGETITAENLVSKLASLYAIVQVSLDNQEKVNETFIKRLDAHSLAQQTMSRQVSAIEGETKATRELVTTLIQRPRNGWSNGTTGPRVSRRDAAWGIGGGTGLLALVEAGRMIWGG
jgi:hypothetical protein